MRENKFPQNYFFPSDISEILDTKICLKFGPGRGSKKLGHLINLRNSCPRFLRCPSFLSYRHGQVETSDVWEISETSDKVISIIQDF